MKNTKRAGILVVSFLFLLIHLISSDNFFVSEAQGQSATPKIEGTQYEGAVILLPYNTTLHTEYIFEKQGRVICRHTTIKQPETKLQYNVVTERQEYVFVPGNQASIDEIGTYKVIGSIISLEFPDRYIEATMKVSGSLRGLEGTVTFKKSNKKEHWIVVETSRTVANPPSSSEKENTGNSLQELEDILRLRPKQARTDTGNSLQELEVYNIEAERIVLKQQLVNVSST
jgi:hypothetical protein